VQLSPRNHQHIENAAQPWSIGGSTRSFWAPGGTRLPSGADPKISSLVEAFSVRRKCLGRPNRHQCSSGSSSEATSWSSLDSSTRGMLPVPARTRSTQLPHNRHALVQSDRGGRCPWKR
jgi:hypothetical protein